MREKVGLIISLLIVIGMIVANRRLNDMVLRESFQSGGAAVVIDAGHGGKDPGKVGVNGVLEKDLNLEIAKKVKVQLEKQGISVFMTREDDSMEENKISDMKKRVKVINEIKPAIAVSIHQNSYTQASVKGAQVFYYSRSKEGENAARVMQTELKTIDNTNSRDIKSNDSFYMLKRTKVPTIIVECGFLSNPDEAEKLKDEEYQQEIAKVICQGIVKWLDS